MSSSSVSSGLSTTFTIIAIVCSVVGLIFCIGLVVLVVCVIKHFNRRNALVQNAMVLQPYPPYSNYVSNPNYPPPYPSAYPPPYAPPRRDISKMPPPES